MLSKRAASCFFGVLAASLFVLPWQSRAQSAAALNFEVASVKDAPNTGRSGVRGGCHGTNST